MCIIFARIYSNKRNKATETLDNSKQSSSLLCNQDTAKVHFLLTNSVPLFAKVYQLKFFIQNPKSSPRWQYNDTKRSKDGKSSTTEVVEDERDPDVIPAQYGK